ncbi:MAG: pilin [Candidatus Magasanikbacteria bacterium]
MKYLHIGTFLLTMFCSLLLSPAITHAQPAGDPLGLSIGEQTGLPNSDVRVTVANIIRIMLGFLGLISVVIIVYAGFRWMTSGGNEEKIKAAQKTLIAAVIGLAIIMSAYSITILVIRSLYEATTLKPYGIQ